MFPGFPLYIESFLLMPFKGKRDKKGIRLSPPPELSLPISNIRGQIEEGQLRRDKRGGARDCLYFVVSNFFFFIFCFILSFLCCFGKCKHAKEIPNRNIQ